MRPAQPRFAQLDGVHNNTKVKFSEFVFMFLELMTKHQYSNIHKFLRNLGCMCSLLWFKSDGSFQEMAAGELLAFSQSVRLMSESGLGLELSVDKATSKQNSVLFLCVSRLRYTPGQIVDWILVVIF